MRQEGSPSKPDRYCEESPGGAYSTDRKCNGGCQGLGDGRGEPQFNRYRISYLQGVQLWDGWR